eukprot:364743-Chlamydomonas_euryale.AAC.117
MGMGPCPLPAKCTIPAHSLALPPGFLRRAKGTRRARAPAALRVTPRKAHAASWRDAYGAPASRASPARGRARARIVSNGSAFRVRHLRPHGRAAGPSSSRPSLRPRPRQSLASAAWPCRPCRRKADHRRQRGKAVRGSAKEQAEAANERHHGVGPHGRASPRPAPPPPPHPRRTKLLYLMCTCAPRLSHRGMEGAMRYRDPRAAAAACGGEGGRVACAARPRQQGTRRAPPWEGAQPRSRPPAPPQPPSAKQSRRSDAGGGN